MARAEAIRMLTKRIKAFIRKHCDTSNMDAEEIADAAQETAEWLIDRGYTPRYGTSDSDIEYALEHITF